MKRGTPSFLRTAVVAWSALLPLNVVLTAPPERSAFAEDVDKEDVDKEDGSANDMAPTTADEARGRARLLHETVHGALQVVHRDFFREDEGLAIPSRSLEDVFRELARSYNVQVRWLAVNAEAMHIDHKPRDDFERSAVKALASGENEFEAVERGSYRHAGVIRLASQCLKCHVPRRTSVEDRRAGLVITMPLKKQ